MSEPAIAIRRATERDAPALVHPGERSHPLHDRIEALALSDLDRTGRALGRC